MLSLAPVCTAHETHPEGACISHVGGDVGFDLPLGADSEALAQNAEDVLSVCDPIEMTRALPRLDRRQGPLPHVQDESLSIWAESTANTRHILHRLEAMLQDPDSDRCVNPESLGDEGIELRGARRS
jgi:hypothetical protein